MERNELIGSGNLEWVAMGLASTTEEKECRLRCAQDPEAKQELEEIEMCLERLAQYFALVPDRKQKQEIEDQIFNADATLNRFSNQYLNGKERLLIRWAVAASILFLLSSGFGFWGYQNLVNTQERLARVNVDFQRLSTENQALYQDQRRLVHLSRSLSKEGAVQVVLQPLKGGSMKATLFWNPVTRELWLMGAELPRLPKGKQYQMWGIVEGKPVDAGVFDGDARSSQILPMKPMASPSMFAVTIENAGGSASPNLQSMCLMAKL